MSKRDVQKYYEQICEQRLEMLNNIKEFEEECQKGMIAPERVQQLQEMVQPFNQNYERISYIMFLLNQPIKQERKEKYKKKIEKLKENLQKENSTEAVLEENKQVIENVKNI